MKLFTGVILCWLALLIIATNAAAIETLIKSVATGCDTALRSYCSKVTPGDGRILASLYAHNDKISGKCEYALFDAAAQLEYFISTLANVANECEADLDKYCSNVRAGEGRLAECLLDKNRNKITERCRQAVKDVGLTYEKQ